MRLEVSRCWYEQLIQLTKQDDLSRANLEGCRRATIRVSELTSSFFGSSCESKYEPTYVLDHMAVIANEKNRATVREIDLHAHQTIRVAWEMVQRNALAEVEAAFVKGLPVPICE